jgi:hypothetical protein
VNSGKLLELHKIVKEKYLGDVNSKLKEIIEGKSSENQIIQDYANDIKRSSIEF